MYVPVIYLYVHCWCYARLGPLNAAVDGGSSVVVQDVITFHVQHY